ncbi:hypothetical protein [Larkinella soli]|uniref:hypothetical protein n=1 Tax=Larkinella soli TaxID=1770527 RepID=UPI000FFB6ABC|nr:hypothetical protein [Larkinella soli]
MEELNRKNPKAGELIVFHEGTDPLSLNTGEGQKTAAAILDAFHGLQARYVHFPYRRPSEITTAEVHYLITFPKLLHIRKEPYILDDRRIMAFLTEYAGFLNHGPAGTPENLSAKKLEALENDLKKYRYSPYYPFHYLFNIPRLERPKFAYKRAAVCFEITVDEDYFFPEGFTPEDDIRPAVSKEMNGFGRAMEWVKEEWDLVEDPKARVRNCDIAHSTETDLFAYKYQSDPPYFTKYYFLPKGNQVIVRLPLKFHFTSEGRHETYYSLPPVSDLTPEDRVLSRELKMEVHLSYTYFIPSNVRIWHLVLTPDETDGISELDIIKFMKYFSGSQENESEEKKRGVLESISFHYDTGEQNTDSKEVIPGRFELLVRMIARLLLFLWQLPVRLIRLPFKSIRKSQRSFFDAIRKFQYRESHVSLIPILKFPIISGVIFMPVYALYSGNYETAFLIGCLLAAVYLLLSVFQRGRQITKKAENLWAQVGHLLHIRETPFIIPKTESPSVTGTPSSNGLIRLFQNLTGIRYLFQERRKPEFDIAKEDRVLSLKNIRSGIIEIDTGAPNGQEDDNLLVFQQERFSEFLNKHAEGLKDKNEEKVRKEIREKIAESYKKLYDKEEGDSAGEALISTDETDRNPIEEYADYVFKAYCGICLGIFDYDRMGLEEIDDTLMPLEESKTEQSFQALNRGVLAMFGAEEDVMNTFWRTLGLSPYLIIPSAVLANNDYVSLDAEKRLDALLNKLKEDESDLSIPQLIASRHEIDDLLNTNILSNVFHYKTEQGIYRNGMESRGINERIKASREKLEQLDREINTKQDERNSRYQRRIQIIVAIVGIINFYSIIRDFYLDELSTGGEDKQSKMIDWGKLNDSWAGGIVRRIPAFLRDLFSSFWENIQPFLPKKSLEMAHFTLFLIVISVVFWQIITNAIDPARSSRMMAWRNRRKRGHRLPKVKAMKPAD